MVRADSFSSPSVGEAKRMAIITLDTERHRLVLMGTAGPITLRGKMVEFFGLLLSAEGWTTAADVHALPAWRGMAHESVGKQVARQIDALRAQGHDLVDWRGKTIAWQFKAAVKAGLDAAVPGEARAWLDARQATSARRFGAVDPAAMAQWAMRSAAATIAITTGEARAGYGALRQAYAGIDHPDLLAITNVLATRIGQRLEEPHDPVPGGLGSYPSVFEQAVEARRMAAYAIRSDSTAWEGQVRGLKRLIPRLSAAGSLTSMAYVHNGIALLLRRLGRHAQALDHVQEAVPLAIFSGDLTLIQSVLFNFGNILSELRRSQPHALPGVDPLQLLEADIAIRQQFGLGKDSAQAELLLAYLAFENGELDRAARWLAASAAIIAVNKAPADRALFHRVAGLLACARQPGNAEGLADLDRAITLFDRLGNKASADCVREERQRLAGAA
jgi:tetratricopeptide (TPR) repeat protein